MRLSVLAVLCFGIFLAQSSCTTGTTNGEAAGAGIGALLSNSMNQIQAPLSGLDGSADSEDSQEDPGVSEDGLRYYGPL